MNILLHDINFSARPLAYRMRPETIEEFIGQEHIIGQGRKLRRMLDSGRMFSSVFYGPPGCGKTALANIISLTLDASIEKINAVNSSVKEIREILSRAREYLKNNKRTVLIIDEIHRFSRNQQEALLPDMEEGNVILIGLTTENPFYFISGPLISRANVFKFEPLSDKDIEAIVNKSIEDSQKGLGTKNIKLDNEAIKTIVKTAGGDARYALNILEIAAISAVEENGEIHINEKLLNDCIGAKKLHYDRTSDQHYDTISAFIKSIRGSDPDAALYYLARMILSGEDPRFIARRIVIAASEDIGNADPQALILANASLNAVEYLGMPEARITLAQAAVYLACAPKSNASYKAIDSAMRYVTENESTYEIPRYLTKSGSKEYKYPHNYKFGYVKQKYMVPEEKFYFPNERGHEKYIRKYLAFIDKLENSTND